MRLLGVRLAQIGEPWITKKVTKKVPISKGSEYLFANNPDVYIKENVESGVATAKNNLRIRLAPSGAKNRQYYRIVLAHMKHNLPVEVVEIKLLLNCKTKQFKKQFTNLSQF